MTDWKYLLTLATLVLAGDQDAAATFSLAVYSAVVRWLRKHGIRDGTEEDIASETLVRVLQNLDRFEERDGAGLNSWVFTIVRHLAFDLAKDRAQLLALDDCDESKFPQPDGGAAETAQPGDEGPDPPVSGELLAAIAELPELDQEILHWKYFADGRADSERSFGEIGAKLGIKDGTARQRHNRAVRRLREILRDRTDPITVSMK